MESGKEFPNNVRIASLHRGRCPVPNSPIAAGTTTPLALVSSVHSPATSWRLTRATWSQGFRRQNGSCLGRFIPLGWQAGSFYLDRHTSWTYRNNQHTHWSTARLPRISICLVVLRPRQVLVIRIMEAEDLMRRSDTQRPPDVREAELLHIAGCTCLERFHVNGSIGCV